MSIAELREITKDYLQPAMGTATRVLDNISLVVGKGDTIAVTGPSGSGKTTLLNILGTLDQPTFGKVFLEGRSVGEMDEKQVAIIRNRFTGFIFQQHLLLPQLTVMENVLLPVIPVNDKLFKEEARERALLLVEKVGLKNHIRKYPTRLSVGECQRAAVVRALVNQPKLLLADEPTGSLDARNAAMLADLLMELSEINRYSIVLVTHDPEVAKRMKFHHRLFNGKLHSTL